MGSVLSGTWPPASSEQTPVPLPSDIHPRTGIVQHAVSHALAILSIKFILSHPRFMSQYRMLVMQVLKGRDLSFYASDAKEERPYATANLEDAVVGVPDIARVSKRHAIEVTLSAAAERAVSTATAAGVAGGAGAGAAAGGRSVGSRIVLAADGKDEQEAWLQSLSVAAVPEAWPGGIDSLKRPQPLLYSLWLARSRSPAASGGAAGGPGKAAAAAAGSIAAAGTASSGSGSSSAPHPMPRLPALRSVPPWARKALLLRKFRLCSVTFDGVPAAVAGEEREAKRNTLLEILDWLDEASAASSGSGSSSSSSSGGGGAAIAPRAALGDLRFFEDLVSTLRCTLFRSLPEAPPPSGDPEEEELPFADPQWGHLNVAYELLLRLVSADAVDLGFKKRVVDAPFVRSLLGLFDSEDARERDYLKVSRAAVAIVAPLFFDRICLYVLASGCNPHHEPLMRPAACLCCCPPPLLLMLCLSVFVSFLSLCADHRAPHLLQADAAAGAAAARRLPRLLRLRPGERQAQRHRGAAGNPRVRHQRLRSAHQGRAPRHADQGAAAAAQSEKPRSFPRAAVLLHGPLRQQGARADPGGNPRPAAPVAAGLHQQAAHAAERAGRSTRVRAGGRRPRLRRAARPAPRPLRGRPPLPGG